MPGTKIGGQRAAQSNKDNHDEEYKKLYGRGFYQQIGHLGGSTPTLTPKGFAAVSRAKRVEAGRKGGLISRKPKVDPLMKEKMVIESFAPKKHWWSK